MKHLSASIDACLGKDGPLYQIVPPPPKPQERLCSELGLQSDPMVVRFVQNRFGWSDKDLSVFLHCSHGRASRLRTCWVEFQNDEGELLGDAVRMLPEEFELVKAYYEQAHPNKRPEWVTAFICPVLVRHLCLRLRQDRTVNGFELALAWFKTQDTRRILTQWKATLW